MAGASITAACATDAGQQRHNNEDFGAVTPVLPGDGRPELWVALVADGVGGHAAGEVASRLAAETFLRSVQTALTASPEPRPALDETIDRAFQEANAAVYAHGASSATVGMATTLTAALVQEDRVYLGHVGDSRAYLVRGGAARPLTRDHTLIREGRAKHLSGEAADRLSHTLTRAMGSRESVFADIMVEELQPGDILVLCTDGLYHTVQPADVAHIVPSSGSAQVACERLVQAAARRDGSDNITVTCVGIGEGSFRQAAPPPARVPSSGLGRLRRPALLVALALVIAAMVFLVRQLWPVAPAAPRPQAARADKPVPAQPGQQKEHHSERAPQGRDRGGRQ